MGLIKALIGGIIGGAVGAGIWAAIAYFANYELGIIAWAVGGLVGFGVGAGAGNSASTGTGVLAAIIALASVAGGKYFAVHATVDKFAQKVTHEITITDDDAKMFMADSLIPEYESNGQALKWAEGKDKESAENPADYPKDLWEDAGKRWQAMSPNDQEAYRKSVEETRKSQVQQFAGTVEKEAFSNSFSLFDLLWAFFAVGTAFRLGSGGIGDSGGD